MTNDCITVVSGLPRSGTSMMMQMLVAGGIPALTDNIREADEDNPRGYYELEAVKKVKEDSSFLDGAGGKVLKMVHLLLYDLPPRYRYRVVFMRRQIEEVLASQRVMLERLGKEGGKLSDADLARVFQSQIAQLQEWLPRQPNFSVCYVSYNQVMKDPAPVVKELNAFLGGALDTGAMMRSVDPTLYRRRQK